MSNSAPNQQKHEKRAKAQTNQHVLLKPLARVINLDSSKRDPKGGKAKSPHQQAKIQRRRKALITQLQCKKSFIYTLDSIKQDQLHSKRLALKAPKNYRAQGSHIQHLNTFLSKFTLSFFLWWLHLGQLKRYSCPVLLYLPRKSLRTVIFSLLDKFVPCFCYYNTIGNVIILWLKIARFCVLYYKLGLVVK